MEQQTNAIEYCLYARKSSESDERQALSIDSQIKEMLQVAEREGIKVAEIRQESHSAKNSGTSPVYQQLVSDIRSRKFQGILTWAPDRLSRNAGDLGSLVDMVDQGLLLEIRTHGQGFRNSPNDKFLLMILCSQAKLENDNRGVNILRGMRNKCELGWRPCQAPLGYLNEKYAKMGTKKVFLDPVRAPVVKEIFDKVAYEGMSGRTLLGWLEKERGFRTRGDKKLPLSSLYQLLNNPFYYGEYEYPVGSGKFYKGNHEAIIPKETFDRVQAMLSAIPRNKGTDPFREPYVREESLITQLIALIQQVAINSDTAASKLKSELERFTAFSRGVLGQTQEIHLKTNDEELRNYLLYLLTNGNREDKHEVLALLESKLYLKDEIIQLL